MTAEGRHWSPEVSLGAMEKLKIDKAILSLPPGYPPDQSNVRAANEELKRMRDRYPARFGFWATLGDLRNTKAVIDEIRYAFDILKANGVSITSSYGEAQHAVYLGDRIFDPVWEELDRRRAAVFLHGAQTRPERPDPHDFLGIPIVEVPHETFKAAASLVVSGRKRKYPNINFVLAHLGGSTPFLAPRVAVLSNYMGSGLTPDDILSDFKTFYYDTALSSHESTLTAMQSFVGPNRVVFGTDFPAVSKDMAAWYTKQTIQFHADPKAPVWRDNILKILANME